MRRILRVGIIISTISKRFSRRESGATSVLGAIILLVAFLVGTTALLRVQGEMQLATMVNSFVNAPGVFVSGDAPQVESTLTSRFGGGLGLSFRVLDLRVSSRVTDPVVINSAGSCVALDPQLKSIGRENWAGIGTNYVRAMGACGPGFTEITARSMSAPINRVEHGEAVPECFSGDTLVLALGDDGHPIKIPIESVRVGMMVLAIPDNEIIRRHDLLGNDVDYYTTLIKLSGKLSPKRVTDAIVHEGLTRGGLRLHLTSGLINTTPEHPFYVVGMGWVPAGSLKVKDKLLSLGGVPVEVLGVMSRSTDGRLYNLTIEDFHTYFVFPKGSDDPILVHNKAIPEI